jgi:hypothetical protein
MTEISDENAMECRDCEEHLQKGIVALKWLQSAERTLRQADYEGLKTFSPELQRALYRLYEKWLAPCEAAQKRIVSLEANGYSPDNLVAFAEACEIANDIVQRRYYSDAVSDSVENAMSQEEW